MDGARQNRGQAPLTTEDAVFAAVLGLLIAAFGWWSLSPSGRDAANRSDHGIVIERVAGTPMPRPIDRPAASDARSVAAVRVTAVDDPDSVAPVAPTTARVRVVLRWPVESDPADGTPVPELLFIDEYGVQRPVSAVVSDTAPTGPHTATREFEIGTAGRYVAAWHAWRMVPGTRTRRACRGLGTEFWMTPDGGSREELVVIAAAELAPDPALDAAVENARWRFTPKDG